jgi:hypothetical protein
MKMDEKRPHLGKKLTKDVALPPLSRAFGKQSEAV